MKQRFFILVAAIITAFNGFSQDRVDKTPEQLSYKSKEVSEALYWSQSSKTGKWESRKNTKLIYLGEGVAIDNFNNLFIGEYKNKRYLFLEYRKYSWRYPNLKQEWIVSRTIMAGLLSDEQYNQMDSLAIGQTLTVIPQFYNSMFKGHAEYSFSMFLSLCETLRSSTETMANSYKSERGDEAAESYWRNEYPLIHYIILKRVSGSNGKDVVRFALYPKAAEELIDNFYFEVEYSVYRNLFTKDKNNKYK